MLTMLVRVGRRVDLHSLKIDAGIGSRSHDFFFFLVNKFKSQTFGHTASAYTYRCGWNVWDTEIF